ncbi:MAG: alpha/beta hydrolase [Candidatus Rokuibacteriota bacterium]|nr:MAG: alpha/beta hydrolase [Candidatus Rokubacteria bacterium]
MVWRLWGAGPHVVLFHGGSGSWSHWARNVMPLARYFTVWAPDLPGFGDSALPPDVETAEALVHIVSSGLDDVITPPTPLDLVGFSFGGIIAGMVAARQGARIRTLVLVGTGGLALGATPIPPLARVTSEGTLAEARAAHRENLEILMFADPSKIDEEAVDAQMENVRRTRFKIGNIPMSDALLRALPDVSARLVALWGGRDAFPSSTLEERRSTLAASHPELDFRVIENAGHWVNWEAADVVNPILLDVLGAAAPART